MSLTETIDQSKKYLKISKATSGYLEVDLFKNADLNKGYFCNNCLYFYLNNDCKIEILHLKPLFNNIKSLADFR